MSTDDKTRIVSVSEAVGPGTQLNGIFEIDEHIAFGGMGEVYRGHNIQTDDPVAIKIVLPEFARDKTMLALFRKEASILSHLANDAIVRYHVFTIDPAIGRPYLAMEFVDGVSLADLITRGPMEGEPVRKLIARIASGLSAAHAAGVIHRDLSPDNIILPGGKVEKAKIIDFGIAKSATGGGTLLGGKFAGKYNFVSPEQLGDFGGEITGRSDIYSLGLVMAAALRGEALDMSGSQVDVIEKRRRMPDISNLDPSLQPILQAMLQPDPDNRPPSMDAVVQWLNGPSQASGAMPPPYSTAERADNPAWQNLPVPGERSFVQRGGTTPPATSQRPLSIPPAGGSIPPPGSIPPLAGQTSVPPTSESPFGAYQPQQSPPQWTGSTPPAAAPAKSRTGLYALVGIVLVALAGGGGAYVTGLFGPASGTKPAEPPVVLNKPPEPGTTTATPPPADVAATPPAAPEAQDPAPPAVAAPPPATATPPTEPPVDTAALPKPVEPAIPPTDKVDDMATRVAWLNNYGGGDCFFATATNVSDTTIDIEGFATSAAPFEAMLAKFKQSYDVDPNIGVRIIEPQQCAVPDFLQALRGSTAEKPELALSSDIIKSGQALKGTLGNLEGRKTDILLVDNAGVVYNLAPHLKNADENASFNIKLGLKTDTPVPQMIIAVTSPNGLDTANVKDPILAETLFPKILAEINDKKVAASATAKYFKLGGS